MLQALPGAAAAVVDEAARRVSALDDLSRRLAAGAQMPELLQSLVPEPLRWVPVEPLHFGCLCSRERSRALLATLDGDERRELAREGGAEVICHYCRTTYAYTAEEL